MPCFLKWIPIFLEYQTTNDLHIGNSLNWCYIDFVARYKRMRGHNAMFPQGWDCHGLPTSARIEKTRGIARHQNPDVRVSRPAQVTRSVLCRVWAKPANPTTVVTATAIERY
ncbi:MAG TPA: hypothetical protein ENF24_00975 [Methanosarcinales archaeon]|nr:hypothetical protein [Methanosarcinales archaeon]